MKPLLIAKYAAIAGAASWAAKAVSMGLGQSQSTQASLLFLLGLFCCLVGAAAYGVAVTEGRPWAVRAAAGVGAVVGFAAFSAMTIAVLSAMGLSDTDHWAWGEVNLWVSALLLLVLTVRTGSERDVTRPEPTYVEL